MHNRAASDVIAIIGLIVAQLQACRLPSAGTGPNRTAIEYATAVWYLDTC